VILSSSGPEYFLPGAPDPAYTQPSTRYLSQYPIPGAATAAHHHETRPEPPHTPLIVMLVLTQLAAGAFVFDAFITPFLADGVLHRASRFLWPAALTTLLAGLTASVFHLGRPMKAWRFFLGLRHSWLSREILAFSILCAVASLGTWHRLTGSNAHGLILQVIVSATALGAIFSSHMIYHDTRRASWMGMRTAGRFFGTAFILGAAFWLLGLTLVASSAPIIPVLSLLLTAATALKLLWEKALRRHHRDAEWTPLGRTALLMRTTFRRVTTSRFLCGFSGGILPLAALFSGRMAPFFATAALALLLVGELLERYLYFRTAVAPRMPGGMDG
jgi:DMSO reductase anchor subunit